MLADNGLLLVLCHLDALKEADATRCWRLASGKRRVYLAPDSDRVKNRAVKRRIIRLTGYAQTSIRATLFRSMMP